MSQTLEINKYTLTLFRLLCAWIPHYTLNMPSHCILEEITNYIKHIQSSQQKGSGIEMVHGPAVSEKHPTLHNHRGTCIYDMH